jgi:hypothetical protein
MKNIYELELYEMTSQGTSDSIRRVPGGWVYGDIMGCCFIPFNNEFQDAAVIPANMGSPKLPLDIKELKRQLLAYEKSNACDYENSVGASSFVDFLERQLSEED